MNKPDRSKVDSAETPASSRTMQLPNDQASLRQMATELHIFLGRLEEEVERAAAAALNRVPTAFRDVEQLTTYIDEHCVHVEQLYQQGLPTQSPSDFNIGSELCVALSYVDRDEFAKRLDSLERAIAVWRPFSRESFPKKHPLMGTGSQKKDMRVERAEIQAKDAAHISSVVSAVEAVLVELLSLFSAVYERIVRKLTGEGADEIAPTKGDEKPGGKQVRDGEKRSWKQPELDLAIREYAAKRASHYSELVSRVKQGDPGAKKAARDMFGRNAIVKALGVKSVAMVSKSTAWHEIAKELELPCKAINPGISPRLTRIGLDIGIEQKAIAHYETAARTSVNKDEQLEKICLMAKEKLEDDEAEAIIEQLRNGPTSKEEAKALIKLLTENP